MSDSNGNGVRPNGNGVPLPTSEEVSSISKRADLESGSKKVSALGQTGVPLKTDRFAIPLLKVVVKTPSVHASNLPVGSKVESVSPVTIPFSLKGVTKRDDCVFCQTPDLSSVWNFLDGVYCISLVDRVDRQNYAAEELHRVGLCQVAQHYLSERPKKQLGDGWGCFVSHQQLAQHAQTQHQKCVLVLEDDFIFNSNVNIDDLPTKIKQALHELPSDFTRLQLGYQPLVSLPYGKTTKRASSTFLHAVIWSPRGLNWMSTMPYRHIYHDFQLAVSLPKSYDISPMLCFQRILGTDNTSKLSEHLFTNPDVMRHSEWTFPLMITMGILICMSLLAGAGGLLFRGTSRWKVWAASILVVMLPISIILITVSLT